MEQYVSDGIKGTQLGSIAHNDSGWEWNREELEEEEEEEQEDDDGRLRWRCGNCGVRCVTDDCDHAYSCHLCTGCSQWWCCKTCRHYLPDVCYDNKQLKTCRVSPFLSVCCCCCCWHSIFRSIPLKCKPLSGGVFCRRRAWTGYQSTVIAEGTCRPDVSYRSTWTLPRSRTRSTSYSNLMEADVNNLLQRHLPSFDGWALMMLILTILYLVIRWRNCSNWFKVAEYQRHVNCL